MLCDEWLRQRLSDLQDDAALDDVLIVELENTLAGCTWDDVATGEQATLLRELLRRGCFPLSDIRQFCQGQELSLAGLNQQLKHQMKKVKDSSMKAFIAQPFWNTSDSLYEQIIEPSCYWEIVCPIKVNKRTKESDLIHKIYKSLDEANLFIADLTENNQNVFYEIGYLEAKKINGVFLSPKSPKLFYTQVKDVIQIEGGRNGVANTRRELREALRALRTKLVG